MKMRCKKARKYVSLAMDKRLEPGADQALGDHLHACPLCRAWQQKQFWLQELVQAPPAIAPDQRFHAGVMERIAASSRPARFFVFSPACFRPAVLRAALVLLLVFSAALGFFLGGPLLDPAPDSQATAFNQTLNLDAFADLPGNSFGAVYDRLLQGELQ